MKKIIAAIFAVAVIAGCSTDADVANENITKAADQFELNRRIVMFNGITDEYLMMIEGNCNITADVADGQLEVICKVDGGYKKHFLGLSDNVSYFVEQLQAADVSTSRYRVIFKPSTIIPDIDVVD